MSLSTSVLLLISSLCLFVVFLFQISFAILKCCGGQGRQSICCFIFSSVSICAESIGDKCVYCCFDHALYLFYLIVSGFCY